MAEADVRATPVIDIVQRGDEIVIRTEAELRAEDVRVEVADGMLEVRVPRRALKTRVVSARAVPTQGQTEQGGPHLGWREHKHGTPGAEPPLGAPDERDFWDAQRPLISEDRVTSIHLEGYSDEQANEIMEALGDDASEEAQGGSATGSDVTSAHGGFPSRDPDQEESGT